MSDTRTESVRDFAWRSVGLSRLAIGLLQGLALYLLHEAYEAKAWPATLPPLFAALTLAALLAPFVALAGLGALRRGTLVAWGLVATAMVAGLAAYDLWRDPTESQGEVLRLLPTPAACAAAAAALFIAHHLIEPADGERRWIARFETYFDTTWRHGVQLALAVGFTAAFWLLLALGAALFKLIGVGAIDALIRHDAFRFPVTPLVFAAAVQLTDARAGLVRGVRTVALTLLAWLGPLMALIVGGFLLTLPFTGLEPLWRTRSATALLLAAAAQLIILTNAAYQDGTEAPPVVLGWTVRLCGLLLAPLTALAAYGLALRVGQYGLSPDRVIAAACLVVAAGYAVGYAIAALKPGPWMRPLERTNIVLAFVSLAVILALFTPLADPARLSVADQMARLQRGAVTPERFDYAFLRFDSGRYGRAAFESLKRSQNARIRQAAETAALLKSRSDTTTLPQAETATILSKVEVFPKGATLPADFVRQFTLAQGLPPFCGEYNRPCRANIRDLDKDGAAEILIEAGEGVAVYKRGPDAWERYGFFRVTECHPSRRSGGHPDDETAQFLADAPPLVAPEMPDILFAGERLRITPEQKRCQPQIAARPVVSPPRPTPR